MSEKKNFLVKDVKVVAVRNQHPTPPVLSDEERKKYTIKSPFPQEFSIPSNIIYYVARNPAFPNGHLKLISTCKSLARMSKILPIKNLWHYGGCEDDINKWNVNNDMSINLRSQFFKLWIWDSICISGLSNLATTLVKQIYKFSIRQMILNNQDLTFKELEILVSGDHLESVSFRKNVVKNDDGSITEFEKVFELLCCKKTKIVFHPEHRGIGKNTINKIIQILSSDQIPVEQHIDLLNVQEDFDFHSFSEFLKGNMTGRQHSIDIHFVFKISDTYKNQLQQFIDEIIQIRGIYAHTVPVISFAGHDFEAFEELRKMRNGHVEGILRKQCTLFV